MLKSHFFNFLKKIRILKSHFLIFWVFHRLWKSANPKKLRKSQSSQPSVSEFFGDPCYYYKGTPRNCQVFPRVCVTLKELAQPSLTFGRMRAKTTSTEHLSYLLLTISNSFPQLCHKLWKTLWHQCADSDTTVPYLSHISINHVYHT